MPRPTPSRKVLFISLVILLLTSQACIFLPEISSETSNDHRVRMIFALAIDPATPTTLYAGIGDPNGGNVFKSTNGGGAWSEVNTGLTNPSVHALAMTRRPDHA